MFGVGTFNFRSISGQSHCLVLKLVTIEASSASRTTRASFPSESHLNETPIAVFLPNSINLVSIGKNGCLSDVKCRINIALTGNSHSSPGGNFIEEPFFNRIQRDSRTPGFHGGKLSASGNISLALEFPRTTWKKTVAESDDIFASPKSFFRA